MEKIIQIIEGRTITALTEDGKVYHWMNYYTDGKIKVFKPTEEEKKKKFKKVREQVQLEDTEGIKFYTDAKVKEMEEEEEALKVENKTANDVITEDQEEVKE